MTVGTERAHIPTMWSTMKTWYRFLGIFASVSMVARPLPCQGISTYSPTLAPTDDTCCSERRGSSGFDATAAPVGSHGWYEIDYLISSSITGCTDDVNDVRIVYYHRGGCTIDAEDREAKLKYCTSAGVLEEYTWYFNFGQTPFCGDLNTASRRSNNQCDADNVYNSSLVEYESERCDLPSGIASSTSFGATAQVTDYFDASCSAARNEWDFTLLFVRLGCHNTYNDDTGVAESIDVTCAHGYRVYNGTGCNTQLTPNVVYAGWVGVAPDQCIATTATDVLSECSTARASCTSTVESLATMVSTMVPDYVRTRSSTEAPTSSSPRDQATCPPTAPVSTANPISTPTIQPTLAPSPFLFRPSSRILIITLTNSLDGFSSSQLQQILDAVKQEVLNRANGNGTRVRRSLTSAQVRVTSTSTTIEVEFAEGTSDSEIDSLQTSFTTRPFVLLVDGTQVESSGATIHSSNGGGGSDSTTIIVVAVVVVVVVIAFVVGAVVCFRKTSKPKQNEGIYEGKQQEVVVTVNNAYGFENDENDDTAKA
eukprot:m.210023 g.210023  ORF g.210023 m.210023 type:complete len:539 (-) comp33059_c0_seq4:3346-4962(-)